MSQRHSTVSRLAARRSTKAIATALIFAASFTAHSQPKEDKPTHGKTGLTRAEVIADLALWRRAGLDRYEVLSRSYSLETPAYLAAQEEYQRLRNSEQFQIEVQKARKD